MSFVYKFPQRFLYSTTPDELRKLADKMEKQILLSKLGDSRTVEISTNVELGFEIAIEWDQEKVDKKDVEAYFEEIVNHED